MENENWPQKMTAICTLIILIITITTAIFAFISINKYFRNDKPSIEINDNTILCQRYEPFTVDEGSEYSRIDTITLNFALIHNNHLNNFLIGNLFLFVSSNQDSAEAFLEDLRIERQVVQESDLELLDVLIADYASARVRQVLDLLRRELARVMRLSASGSLCIALNPTKML